MSVTYKIKSRTILDIFGDIQRKRLILSPHFQRNLVWRELHKTDFIETILEGYPFPQIFVAQGDIDIEQMAAKSCVVDGQQRLSTIKQFLEDELPVNGRRFSELSQSEKESFLKYDVAIIELEIRDSDPRLKEIFQRLNRTFYALSQIEKLSTEYASSEFMLVAKILADELFISEEIEEAYKNLEFDPNITGKFLAWAKKQNCDAFHTFVFENGIFSSYETSRLVHLMFILNLMSTYIFGFYNRNDKVKEYLDMNSDHFQEKEQILEIFDECAHFYNSMRFHKDSIWRNKSNAFTLFILISSEIDAFNAIGAKKIADSLKNFEINVPPLYAIAAKEGVNNRKERLDRDRMLRAHLKAETGIKWRQLAIEFE